MHQEKSINTTSINKISLFTTWQLNVLQSSDQFFFEKKCFSATKGELAMASEIKFVLKSSVRLKFPIVLLILAVLTDVYSGSNFALIGNTNTICTVFKGFQIQQQNKEKDFHSLSSNSYFRIDFFSFSYCSHTAVKS